MSTLSPLEALTVDARAQLRGKTWEHLWSYAMTARLSDALNLSLGYPTGAPAWELDLLAWGGFPWTLSQVAPSTNDLRFLVAETKGNPPRKAGGVLWASFDANRLRPSQRVSVHLANLHFTRTVIRVDYWAWREARKKAGLKPLRATQTAFSLESEEAE
jgi:hypothetical protein